MKDNLYHFFNCDSKEELYEKVRSNNPDVASLSDFINYSKGSVADKSVNINSVEKAFSVVKNHLPNEGESKILFVNTKNVPVHVGTVFDGDKKSFRSVIKDGLGAGGSQCFTIKRQGDFSDKRPYDDATLEVMDISLIDHFIYEERNNSIYSFEHRKRKSLGSIGVEYGLVSDEVSVYETDVNDSLRKLMHFDEFSSFYANKEVTGLNVFDEVDDVQEALKVGYQYEFQEVFGVLICDSEGFVKSMSEISRGGVDSAIVDPRIYMNEVFQHEDASYAIVFHNHPSGNPQPSNADKQVTNRLSRVSNELDVELLDHYIIGQDKVYSFALEREASISHYMNDEYYESINAKKKHKEKYGKQLSLTSLIKEDSQFERE